MWFSLDRGLVPEEPLSLREAVRGLSMTEHCRFLFKLPGGVPRLARPESMLGCLSKPGLTLLQTGLLLCDVSEPCRKL